MHALQPALLDREILTMLVGTIERKWRDGEPAAILKYGIIKDFIRGSNPEHPAHGSALPPPSDLICGHAQLSLLRPRAIRYALFERIPFGAVFVHTTHYPHDYLFRWLARRKDVKAVFFIHDLLPLQFPEYFSPSHAIQHRRSLEIFARYGQAAIVNTQIVADQVRRFLDSHNRRDVAVLVRPIPPDSAFSAPIEADPDLAGIPYFVVCGTIEPRKNHLMLLHVWRELSRHWGKRTPKLVIIGRRGWENENVVDLLDRSQEIRRHVIEVAGLPSAAVARLMASARALLMPSFGEGYGLPIVEARAAGVPVIASDIPVFHEIAPDATFRRPLDGAGWLDAIKSHVERRGPRTAVPAYGSRDTRRDYFDKVENFIRSL